jgi:hypothetical protein
MLVFMSLDPMPGMVVIVPLTFARVLVIMGLAPHGVTMLMAVLVSVFVVMGTRVFVAVFGFIMRVLVRVSMGMLVGMQMFVFVFFFHRELL